MWRDRFGADPSVVGRAVQLDQRGGADRRRAATRVRVAALRGSERRPEPWLWLPKQGFEEFERDPRFRVLERARPASARGSIAEANAELDDSDQLARPQTNKARPRMSCRCARGWQLSGRAAVAAWRCGGAPDRGVRERREPAAGAWCRTRTGVRRQALVRAASGWPNKCWSKASAAIVGGAGWRVDARRVGWHGVAGSISPDRHGAPRFGVGSWRSSRLLLDQLRACRLEMDRRGGGSCVGGRVLALGGAGGSRHGPAVVPVPLRVAALRFLAAESKGPLREAIDRMGAARVWGARSRCRSAAQVAAAIDGAAATGEEHILRPGAATISGDGCRCQDGCSRARTAIAQVVCVTKSGNAVAGAIIGCACGSAVGSGLRGERWAWDEEGGSARRELSPHDNRASTGRSAGRPIARSNEQQIWALIVRRRRTAVEDGFAELDNRRSVFRSAARLRDAVLRRAYTA